MSQTGVLTEWCSVHRLTLTSYRNCHQMSQTGVPTQSYVLSTDWSCPAGIAARYPRQVFLHWVMFCPQIDPDVLQELPPDVPDRCSDTEWCSVHWLIRTSCRNCRLMSQTGVLTLSDVLSTDWSGRPAGIAACCQRQLILHRVMFCPQIDPDVLQELLPDVPDRCSYTEWCSVLRLIQTSCRNCRQMSASSCSRRWPRHDHADLPPEPLPLSANQIPPLIAVQHLHHPAVFCLLPPLLGQGHPQRMSVLVALWRKGEKGGWLWVKVARVVMERGELLPCPACLRYGMNSGACPLASCGLSKTCVCFYRHKDLFICWLVCITFQQNASVFQRPICSDSCACFHTERETADQTFCLTQ